MQVPLPPAFSFLLYSSYESLLSPSTFFILLSFHIHVHDFEYLDKSLEVTMGEHSGYLSFWEWFNSLDRSISTCICFSTENTNQHFKFLLPIFWHFLQWNVNLWSQGSLWTCPFLSISKFTSNQTKYPLTHAPLTPFTGFFCISGLCYLSCLWKKPKCKANVIPGLSVRPPLHTMFAIFFTRFPL